MTYEWLAVIPIAYLLACLIDDVIRRRWGAR